VKRIAIGTLKQVAWLLLYGVAGAFLVLLIGFVLFVNSKADLSVWHTAELDEEFSEDSEVGSFAEYLELERRLFTQLEERVFERIAPGERSAINRFHRGSLSDPGRWPRDWNRSTELSTSDPRAGVLLLHGLSDSPYSLRSLGERLHASGAQVLALRIPGHGTAPVGLTRVRWQDMAAAVRLAARHLKDRVPDRPLFLVGYSNGGALSVLYAISALEDESLPAFDGIVLLSPEIGISPAAAFAVWQERIGRLLGLEKLKWNSVLPEYDPFKYQSFAVNAGDQAHRLTGEIARRLGALAAQGDLDRFPPVLVFQSAVDATVSTPAVIDGLMARLPDGGHELVLFDLNRMTEIEHILQHDPAAELSALLRSAERRFALTVVTNASETSRQVVVQHRPAGRSEARVTTLDQMWPAEVFSLAHVALPFPASDPLYGDGSGEDSPGIHIGSVALRGEHGVLQIPAADMLRQRWNPFHPYVERRLLEFTRLE
jgi:alpha-beta hydrolase superfamily lysophospholipase